MNGIRYFSLFDDAMVTMRYARHLAEGYGLVWNIGEQPIEGFTNQLWVLVMALFHLLITDRTMISLFIQLLAVVILMINLIVVYKIALLLKPGLKTAALGAVILTGFYLPLNFWSLMGMEVSLVALLTSISVWYSLKLIDEHKYSIFQLIIPALGIFIRPDAVLIFLVIMAFVFVKFPNDRKKIFITGSIILVLSLGIITIVRFSIFGDYLPNTYYLKMTGYPLLLRWGRGIFVSAKFIIGMLVAFYFPAVYLFRKKDSKITFIMMVFFVQIAYSIYVGGDAWEWWGGSNRFVSVAMPMLFVVMALSFIELKDRLIKKFRFFEKFPKLSFPIIICLALLIVNSTDGPKSLKQWMLIERPFTSEENEKCVKIVKAVDELLEPGGSVLVNTAGVIPYFLSDRKIFDMLGKNDKFIARLPMKVSTDWKRFFNFNPGHLKWDYSYSIGKQKPDLIVHLWKDPEMALPYLKTDFKKIKIFNFEFWGKTTSNYFRNKNIFNDINQRN